MNGADVYIYNHSKSEVGFVSEGGKLYRFPPQKTTPVSKALAKEIQGTYVGGGKDDKGTKYLDVYPVSLSNNRKDAEKPKQLEEPKEPEQENKDLWLAPKPKGKKRKIVELLSTEPKEEKLNVPAPDLADQIESQYDGEE